MALVVGDFPDDVIWGEVPAAQAVVAIGTIMVLHTLLVYLSYRSLAVDRLMGSAPTPVVRDGALDEDGMRHERLNRADVASLLRERGIDDWRTVRRALVEPSGLGSASRLPDRRPAQKRDAGRLRGAA